MCFIDYFIQDPKNANSLCWIDVYRGSKFTYITKKIMSLPAHLNTIFRLLSAMSQPSAYIWTPCICDALTVLLFFLWQHYGNSYLMYLYNLISIFNNQATTVYLILVLGRVDAARWNLGETVCMGSVSEEN